MLHTEIPEVCPTPYCPDHWKLKVRPSKGYCPQVKCEPPPTPEICPNPECPPGYFVVVKLSEVSQNFIGRNLTFPGHSLLQSNNSYDSSGSIVNYEVKLRCRMLQIDVSARLTFGFGKFKASTQDLPPKEGSLPHPHLHMVSLFRWNQQRALQISAVVISAQYF